MLPFDDAVKTVLANVPRREPARVPLAEAVGLVLAEDVASDVDMPPFNKSAMDGFAVVAADLATAPRMLHVVEEVPAGAVPTRKVRPGECARIMTGAPVPEGADAVVRIEDTEPSVGKHDVVVKTHVDAGANICVKAEDVARGDVVLRAGHLVRPPEVATLAACGCVEVPAYPRPTVAVLSTGDEVVPPGQVPEAGQIRDANSPYVAARLRVLGVAPALLGIAPDKPAKLKAALARGLKHDVLIVSGGVSTGDYDLVPALLRDLETEVFFDSVAMQPGRPTVFGRRGEAVVFGLPGNPVSVLIATELLVVPALKAMMGHRDVHPPRCTAILTEDARHRPGRLAHIPGVLSVGTGGRTARPLPYHGSAHIHALSRANALIALPADVAQVAAGTAVEAIELHF